MWYGVGHTRWRLITVSFLAELWIRIRIQHFKWIRIRIDIRIQSGSMVLMTKKLKTKIQQKIFLLFFFYQIDYLCPRYSRSLKPSKENIQHFKIWNLLIFLCLRVIFALLDPGYGFRDPIESGSRSIAQHCFLETKGVPVPVLRIRDVCPGSDFFPSRIPDPNCLHPGSRIRIKEFRYFHLPKNQKNGF